MHTTDWSEVGHESDCPGDLMCMKRTSVRCREDGERALPRSSARDTAASGNCEDLNPYQLHSASPADEVLQYQVGLVLERINIRTA
jgi:hypothetical protein